MNDKRFTDAIENPFVKNFFKGMFYGIIIGLGQKSYSVIIHLSNTTFKSLKDYNVLSVYTIV